MRSIGSSRAREAWIRRPGDGARGAAAAAAKRLRTLAEPRLELLRLTLQREAVAAWFELFQKRLDGVGHRELGPIVDALLNVRRSATHAERRNQAGDEPPRRLRDAAPPAHRTGPARGMPADSDSLSAWRRSPSSCFHSQRRPPGMRISTSTGPA